MKTHENPWLPWENNLQLVDFPIFFFEGTLWIFFGNQTWPRKDLMIFNIDKFPIFCNAILDDLLRVSGSPSMFGIPTYMIITIQ